MKAWKRSFTTCGLRHAHRSEEVPNEAQRIRSAVTVDFILSVEIVILALGQVMEADFQSKSPLFRSSRCLPRWGCTAWLPCWSGWTTLAWL